MPPAEASLAEVFLGREPIIDSERRTFGYDFFSPSPGGGAGSPAAAAAAVVCQVFAELGLANVLGTQRAFIPVDEEFLAEDAIELVREKNVVLDIRVDRPLSEATLARLRSLRDAGYEFCASGVARLDTGTGRLATLAKYIKIDARTVPAADLRALAHQLRTKPGVLLATGVASEAVFRQCRDAGFNLFQGYFFARPEIVEGRKLDPATQSIFRILNLIAADADTGQIETAFKADPALAVNLLRLTNSVAVGLAVRIGSIRQAIAILGRKQLQRWLQLLVFAGNRTDGLGRNPLMQLAALRAHFMETLAARSFPERNEMRETAFLTGLLSLMPAALGMSMLDILASITVAPEVRRALAKGGGELGELLRLTESYDDNDCTATRDGLLRLGGRIDLHDLGEILAEVIAWVQALDIEAA